MADRLTQLQEAVNQASYSSMRCSVGMPFNRWKSIKPFLYVNDALQKMCVHDNKSDNVLSFHWLYSWESISAAVWVFCRDLLSLASRTVKILVSGA